MLCFFKLEFQIKDSDTLKSLADALFYEAPHGLYRKIIDSWMSLNLLWYLNVDPQTFFCVRFLALLLGLRVVKILGTCLLCLYLHLHSLHPWLEQSWPLLNLFHFHYQLIRTKGWTWLNLGVRVEACPFQTPLGFILWLAHGKRTSRTFDARICLIKLFLVPSVASSEKISSSFDWASLETKLVLHLLCSCTCTPWWSCPHHRHSYQQISDIRYELEQGWLFAIVCLQEPLPLSPLFDNTSYRRL